MGFSAIAWENIVLTKTLCRSNNSCPKPFDFWVVFNDLIDCDAMEHPLQQTPLYNQHTSLQGKMVPFGGWLMPLQFQGILAETRAVRTRSGIFDVSHMGRITVDGPHAGALLDWIHSNDVGGLAVGRAKYGLLCTATGGIIDDGIVYRLSEEKYMLIANASNTKVVLDWLLHWNQTKYPKAHILDITREKAMVALQGPEAIPMMQELIAFLHPEPIRPFGCKEGEINGRPVLVARTGYTGEDGVELILSEGDAAWLWEILRENGATLCGLGARDVLRLEAALLLHGADMNTDVNPVEAGLERFVKSDKDFHGRDAVRNAEERGVGRKLIGFQTLGRGAVPRSHHSIKDGSRHVGEVTSGGYSPTLDTNIGLGYVAPECTVPGTRLSVDVRGRSVAVEVVTLPFYSRKRN